MRRVAAILSTAAMLAFVVVLHAQKPDFSGKWTREGGAPGGGGGGAAGGGGGGGGRGGGGGFAGGGGGGGFACGMSCEIKVSGNDITITRPGPQGGADIVTKLNMAGDATNKVAGRNGAPDSDVKTTGKTEGNTVTFTTTRDMGGNSVTTTQKVSIEGGKLTIVTDSGRGPQTATYTKG